MFVAVGSKHVIAVVTLGGVFMIIVLVAFVFFLFLRPSSDDRNCQNTKCVTLQAVNAYCLMLLAIPSMFLLVQQVTCNSNDGF